MTDANLIDVNAFLPGRTLVAKHVLSDLLRQHDTPTQRFMIPALMNLYLEQRIEKMIEPSDRRRADEVVIYQQMMIWQSDPPTNRLDALHFTILANQYIVSLRMCCPLQ